MVENIRIQRVIIFLFLTFLLSWGFDWLLIEMSGLDPYQGLGMSPWGMLVPAFVVILLQIYVYEDSPLFFKTYQGKPRWVLIGTLILTLFYGVLVWVAALSPAQLALFQGLGAFLFTLWTLLLFFISGQSKEGSFKGAGLELGDVRLGVRFILGAVGFFLLQAGLNLLFGLGDFVGKAERIYGLPIPPHLYIPAVIVLFPAVTVIGIPLSGLAGVVFCCPKDLSWAISGVLSWWAWSGAYGISLLFSGVCIPIPPPCSVSFWVCSFSFCGALCWDML